MPEPIEGTVVPAWQGPQPAVGPPESLASDMVELTTEYGLNELPAPLRRALVSWCELYRAWAIEQPVKP
jgi:hypothetical protein